ncbi:MAG: hypothetical protein JW727_06340 [Candidatus Aenigmarchaeota archaeon]|nr:hypothetical protein [Candidatus Aenigmarchaeota archaeon]
MDEIYPIVPQDPPPQSPPPEENQKNYSTSRKKYLLAVIGIIIVIVSIAFLSSYLFGGSGENLDDNKDIPQENSEKTEKLQSVKNNGVCESGENCLDDREDCTCRQGEYCSLEKKSCVSPICGNGECEYFEDPNNCNKDCGCWQGQVYDSAADSCVEKAFTLSEMRIGEVLDAHYSAKGMALSNFTITNTTVTYQNEVGIEVFVSLKSQEGVEPAIVLENGTVVESTN